MIGVNIFFGRAKRIPCIMPGYPCYFHYWFGSALRGTMESLNSENKQAACWVMHYGWIKFDVHLIRMRYTLIGRNNSFVLLKRILYIYGTREGLDFLSSVAAEVMAAIKAVSIWHGFVIRNMCGWKLILHLLSFFFALLISTCVIKYFLYKLLLFDCFQSYGFFNSVSFLFFIT